MLAFEWTIYSLAALVGAVGSALGVVAAWRFRRDAAARHLILAMLATAWWCLFAALERACVTLPGSLVWAKVRYLGVAFAPTFFVLFAFGYGRQRRIHLALRVLLYVVPAVTLLIVWTDSWHHLFWPGTTIAPGTHLLQFGRGPAFRVFAAYVYVVNGIGFMALVISAFGSQSIVAGQRVAVLVGALFPLVANVLYLKGLLPIPEMDWTPTSFAATFIILSLSIRHQRLFDLRPVLRGRLLDTMSEAVVLVDDRGRVADYNREMARIAPAIVDAIGAPCTHLMIGPPELCQALMDNRLSNETVELQVLGQRRVYDMRVRALQQGGRDRGRLVVLHDITQEHQLEVERDGLLAELRQALAHAERLGGLIPICANCKRIRDDRNLWQDVEAYLAEHSAAELAAAICPDCQAKLSSQNETGDGTPSVTDPD